MGNFLPSLLSLNHPKVRYKVIKQITYAACTNKAIRKLQNVPYQWIKF